MNSPTMLDIMRDCDTIDPCSNNTYYYQAFSNNTNDVHVLPNFTPPMLEAQQEPNYVSYSGSTELTPTPHFLHSPTPESMVNMTPNAPRGRSLGENSSQPIKNLRKRANRGDMEAALKLGWSVERLTQIYNQQKVARGEHVSANQPIDDENLLLRIQERHKTQSEAAKKRAAKLKAQALAGNFEAAKKLKYGAKRMAELFPDLVENPSSSSAQEELYGFQTERTLSAPEPVYTRIDHLSPNSLDIPPQDEKSARVETGREEWSARASQGIASSLPQPYPMPEEGRDVELRLEKELKEAQQVAICAQKALANAKQADSDAAEKLREAERRFQACRVAKPRTMAKPAVVRPRSKKARENRRSNFLDD